MVKTDLALDLGDIRELIPRLQKLKTDYFVCPNSPGRYRRRVQSLLIQISEKQPDLIPETQIDVEDYGLHSWRKMGVTLTAAAGMHDYKIIEYGRWEPRVHKIRPPVATRRKNMCGWHSPIIWNRCRVEVFFVNGCDIFTSRTCHFHVSYCSNARLKSTGPRQ
jgi:hypothetical protein